MSRTHMMIEKIGIRNDYRNMGMDDCGNPYHLLCAAVIHQAVVDMHVCRKIKNDFSDPWINDKYQQSQCSALNLMKFFTSDWLAELLSWSDVTPESVYELAAREIGRYAEDEKQRMISQQAAKQLREYAKRKKQATNEVIRI